MRWLLLGLVTAAGANAVADPIALTSSANRRDGGAPRALPPGISDDARALEAGAAYARLSDRIATRVAYTDDGTGHPQPSVHVSAAVLHQAASGVDLAVSGGYAPMGWTGTDVLISRIAIGRSAGAVRATASAAFGAGLGDGERYGELDTSVMRTLGRGVRAGIEGTASMDLERDNDEPVGEKDHELRLCPVLALPLGRFGLSAAAGVSAYRLREAPGEHLGAIGIVGVSAAF